MEDLLFTKDELTFAFYTVGNYDELCEEHFKIEKIIPIKKTKGKTVLNIILHILTGFLIQFIYGIFPKLEKFICYEETTLDVCERLFIHCSDGKFYFTDISKCSLPKINNPDILLPGINYSLQLILFKFKLFTYIFNSKTNKFDALKFQVYRTKQEILEKMIKGLNDDEREYQRSIYGECDLNFYVRSFLETVYDNMCDFFFFFQVFAIILWCFTGFAVYAGVVSCLVIYSLMDTSFEVRNNLLSIKKMSRYCVDINLYESNCIKPIKSVELVPGDIFELPPDGKAIPCDCILLSGSVIVNEAMLTGESTPIIKTHLPLLETRFDYESDAKHMLYSGTKIVQKRPENKKPLLCLCYSTGFNTVRGNLIRSVLYPKKGDTSFMVDSINILKIMIFIFVVGFLALLPYKIKFNIIDEEDPEERRAEIKELFEQVLDLLTQAIPPELPLCLGICLGIAQKRCKKRNIMCINKDKINSAGKIKVCVFDKTGTLTEDHLDIHSYIPITVSSRNNQGDNKTNFVFGKETNSVREMAESSYLYYKDKMQNPSNKSAKKEMNQLFIECLACCQGATIVNNELIGDPIDVQMFNSTGWNLIEEPNDPENYNPKILTFVRPSKENSLTQKLEEFKGKMNESENAEKIDNIMRNHYELGIIRRFDFESKLQRMSSVVKSLTGTSFMCYCKGSPEKISELCQENTIPDNFNEVLNRYTSQGFRVLALSCKVMQMTYDQAIEIPRDLAEKDLIFLGLLIVENQLKEATSRVLKSLSEDGHLRVRMATGDNILTAICVSRKSNLIPPDSTVYSCEIEEQIVNENEEDNNIINTNNKNDENEYIKSGIQKEKKTIKKLIWKTIENFNELDYEEQDSNISNQSQIIGRESINVNKVLGVLAPQEIDDDEDYNAGDKKSNLISEKASAKTNKSIQQNEEDEFMNINVDLTDLPFKKEEENITIAIAGKTFEMLYYMNQKYETFDENNEEFPLFRTNTQREMAPSKIALQPFHEAFRLILRHASVYARCSPDNKTQLVQSLQKEGFQVLMCGDGANDCGALKAANVGVSLSQEEASIAAPFTSTNPDITCIIEVLNQGKCALVTSVEIFKYMIIISLDEFFSMTLMMFRDTFLYDYQSICIDLFITLPLCTFLPMTGAYERFNYHRPYSNLASFPIFISVFFQFLFNASFQFGGFLLANYYFPKDIFICSRDCKGDINQKSKKKSDKIKDCLDNAIIYHVSYCQYLFTGLVLVSAAPFKKKIYTNCTLFIFSIICFIYIFYIIIINDPFSKSFLHLIPFPDDKYNINKNTRGEGINLPNPKIPFKYIVVLFCLLNFVLTLFFEKVIVSKIIKEWSRKEFKKQAREIRKTELEPTLNLINDVKNYVREHERNKIRISRL